VVFTGFSTNIHNYLKCSDLEILPSSAEGFGIVILEAWHSEIPVIAFDVPAPNEIITDGEDGYLIPPFDKEILKEKIIYLLKNKDIAKNMGKAGKKKLETQYTMEIMLSKTIAMYKRVLNAS
jgi:glycosyltransferase involved in cell wall biosynthesis